MVFGTLFAEVFWECHTRQNKGLGRRPHRLWKSFWAPDHKFFWLVPERRGSIALCYPLNKAGDFCQK